MLHKSSLKGEKMRAKRGKEKERRLVFLQSHPWDIPGSRFREKPGTMVFLAAETHPPRKINFFLEITQNENREEKATFSMNFSFSCEKIPTGWAIYPIGKDRVKIKTGDKVLPALFKDANMEVFASGSAIIGEMSFYLCLGNGIVIGTAQIDKNRLVEFFNFETPEYWISEQQKGRDAL